MLDEVLAALAQLALMVVARVIEGALNLPRVGVGVVLGDVTEQLGQEVVVPFGLFAARHGRHGHILVDIENIGLYWHFVDLVWIFLFPLLYLF